MGPVLGLIPNVRSSSLLFLFLFFFHVAALETRLLVWIVPDWTSRCHQIDKDQYLRQVRVYSFVPGTHGHAGPKGVP
jgi:hypothetical protein